MGIGRARVQQAIEADPLAEALADREAEMEFEAAGSSQLESTTAQDAPNSAALAERVSQKAFDLIVRHETGGPEYYKRKYKEGPVWPEASSGVTIGFGYDLGYQPSVQAFRADWAGVLPAQYLDMLEPAVGVHAGDGHDARGRARDERVRIMKAIVTELIEAGVRIPWDKAEVVFRRTTLPRYARETWTAVPNCETLSADCFGALVSLTFNRGPSYGRAHDAAKDPIDRYREMRAIRAAMDGETPEKVAAAIRAMKRIWKGKAIEAEMNRRRENEARLFEEGLAAILMARAEVEPPPVAAPIESRFESALSGRPASGIVSTGTSDEQAFGRRDLESPASSDLATDALEAVSGVRWAPDGEAPDYAHLENALPPGVRFRLTADDLEFLATLNDFPVADSGNTPVLFGLRGCGIVDASEELQDEVQLVDQRPDHKVVRCVIGAWHRSTKKIAVFPASTVPNSEAVMSWFNDNDAGNMLPTGLYGYIVGPHNGRPGCWLLRETIDRKRTVIVRRSSNDRMYDVSDLVDICQPGDNLHPTFKSGPSWFSSLGCQVVVGNANSGGNHTGPWAKFRKAAGLTTSSGKNGTPYQYMLLTGLEALLASRARKDGATEVPEVRQSLRRLRFGSKGTAVGRLQTYLGIAPSGEFTPQTAKVLHIKQRELVGQMSDGLFTPKLEAQLAIHVFSEPPPAPVEPVAPAADPADALV